MAMTTEFKAAAPTIEGSERAALQKYVAELADRHSALTAEAEQMEARLRDLHFAREVVGTAIEGIQSALRAGSERPVVAETTPRGY